ncbi:MAG: peptidase S41 [Anaerolineales bacterium]|nr:peptidase S41 [Anaerolineales bacterium]
MKTRSFQIVAAILLLCMAIVACAPKLDTTATTAPTESPVVVVEEGGPKTVTGNVTYTNFFFTEGVAQPIIILEDQGGFVTRDRKFLIPVESQVIGEITSDFYTSPFTYSVSLPSRPNGTLHDVDHDGVDEAGVMIFAVAYWTNTWGDPFLERRDQGGGGWSGAYASTKVTDDPNFYLEVTGGKYLVYAQDDQQQFPSGFGDDKKLFTDDDPIMDLPAGWSVVDLDQSPFSIDRSENPTIELYEPESAALVDFSGLSYTEAFDGMAEKFKNEYAFTDLKKIDWDAKVAEFRPRFEEAEKNKDKHAYALALRDYLWSIPDTHVGFGTDLLDEDFSTDTAGGLGFGMRETDDGKIIANFILDGGPASAAGMTWGSEIISLDGVPTSDVVDKVIPWSSPFSNPEIKRLQQLRYATRFKMDKGEVEVKFKNIDGAEKTAKLEVVNEFASFNFSSFRAGVDAEALPVEFDLLPSGYGYIKISSFLDNDVLSIQVWERAIKYFNDNQVPGVILDLRNNGGGSGWLADQMAAYFFDKEIIVGNSAQYNKATGEFYMDPGDESPMIPPRAELQYSGPVVVMVGPNCASACEFFSYNMTVNDRATVVGQYPSEGAGGSVEDFSMPEDITVQLTIGRAVDAEGNIHLEGSGVVPDVRVPVTLETLQRLANGEDVVLAAAEKVISEPQGAGLIPSGPPEMASAAAASSALTSGKSFLEDLAREQYESADFGVPGTLTYTIPLTKTDTLVWLYAWCTASTEILNQNFENIDLKFVLDGEEIPLDKFRKEDLENGGQQCRLYYTALSKWPAGEHHLSTKATFKAAINDGTADYEPGDYILDYAVYLKP